VKNTEHGLGQLLNPLDPERQDRDWIGQTWQGLVHEALGGPRFCPDWGDVPAMMKSAVTTPMLLARFHEYNRKKGYPDRVKPFNFLLSATVNAMDRPPDAADTGFHPIAPYSSNPADWQRSSWTDLHTGREYRIRPNARSSRAGIRVQTYADVLDRFRNNPEPKSADARGNQSSSRTIGLLARLHVSVLPVFHIGKETNLIEQHEEGVLLADPQAVYLSGGEWEAVRSQLDSVPTAKLAELSGVSPRMIRALRRGDRRPSAKTVEAITEALVRVLNDRHDEEA
jgi:hypothetical protein